MEETIKELDAAIKVLTDTRERLAAALKAAQEWAQANTEQAAMVRASYMPFAQCSQAGGRAYGLGGTELRYHSDMPPMGPVNAGGPAR